jgi:hypothetical protein
MSLYAADGSLNITVVSGSTYVGRYAPDGSMNVVVSNGSTYTGLHHPSGAMYVIDTNSPITSIQHPSGAWYVSDSPYQTGANRVTVVSGSLGGGGATAYTYYIYGF